MLTRAMMCSVLLWPCVVVAAGGVDSPPSPLLSTQPVVGEEAVAQMQQHRPLLTACYW